MEFPDAKFLFPTFGAESLFGHGAFLSCLVSCGLSIVGSMLLRNARCSRLRIIIAWYCFSSVQQQEPDNVVLQLGQLIHSFLVTKAIARSGESSRLDGQLHGLSEGWILFLPPMAARPA